MTLATANLQQHALDYVGNRERIVKSIHIAKEKGATFRSGSELEITGYSCLYAMSMYAMRHPLTTYIYLQGSLPRERLLSPW